ncbi:carboxypeptidase-like regulatory domain-containing protein [Hymenobacter sp. HD11105]
MSLFSTLTALTKPVLVLTLLGSSLLANPALANEPTTKTKRGSVEKASTSVAAVAPAVAPVAVTATTAMLTLTGRIRNEEGQPLAGATVYLHGSDLAVITDTEGKFVIEVPAAGKKTLRYGYGGYNDRDVVIGTSAPLTMSLQPSAATLKERKDK